MNSITANMLDRCCNKCKFWVKPDIGNYVLREDASDMDKAYFNKESNFGVCVLGESNNGFPVSDKTLMFASDSEGYGATVSTKAEFSCNMFQSSDEIMPPIQAESSNLRPFVSREVGGQIRKFGGERA